LHHSYVVFLCVVTIPVSTCSYVVCSDEASEKAAKADLEKAADGSNKNAVLETLAGGFIADIHNVSSGWASETLPAVLEVWNLSMWMLAPT
jgi:hypothetical protein